MIVVNLPDLWTRGPRVRLQSQQSRAYKGQSRTMGNRRNGKTEPNGAATAEGKFSLISNEKLIALYQNLLKYGRIGRRGGSSNGNHGATHGHHAAMIGTAIDLGPDR